MTSKIVVNNIQADAGVSTVTFGSNISGNFVGSISVSGVTTVAAGSTSAPAISPTGDSNTGIFFPSADTIAIATGGSERIRVGAGNSVGIGTNSPTAYAGTFLHIHDTSTRSALRLTNSSSGTTRDDGFELETRDGYAQIVYRENGYLVLATNNTEAARITSTGNVEIANGNLVFSTAGKGIDFSATANSSGTMTSELLSDYEEGTWTPNQGSGVTVSGSFSSGGYYTKIGRTVTVHARLQGSTNVSVSGNGIICTNLPFQVNATIANYITGSLTNWSWNISNTVMAFGNNTNTVYNTVAVSATDGIFFTITYITSS